jgi:hypothetical protein
MPNEIRRSASLANQFERDPGGGVKPFPLVELRSFAMTGHCGEIIINDSASVSRAL